MRYKACKKIHKYKAERVCVGVRGGGGVSQVAFLQDLDISLTFLQNLLPQRVHQDRVRVSSAVNDGQFAFRQFEMIGKLSIELCNKNSSTNKFLFTVKTKLFIHHL